MKAFLFVILVAISRLSTAQPFEGIDITYSGIFNWVSNYEKINHQVTRDDGSQDRIKDYRKVKTKFTMGTSLQAGYNINTDWTFGVQGGISTSVESWLIIIPNEWGLYYFTGVFGKYHVNDEFSFFSSLTMNKNYNYSPKIALGFGPEALPITNRYGFRMYLEYGIGGQRFNANIQTGQDAKGTYRIDKPRIVNQTFTLQIATVYRVFGA